MTHNSIYKYIWSHVERESPIIILSKNKYYFKRFRCYLRIFGLSLNRNKWTLYRRSYAPIKTLSKISFIRGLGYEPKP